MKFGEKMKQDFTVMVLLLIPVAIAINVVGGTLTTVLKLPIDLDMIGVILIGALAGPLPAAVAGVLTNLINGIIDPTWIPYAVVAFAIGIAAGELSKHKMLSKPWKVVVSGLIIALVATSLAAPITIFFFGGIHGGGASAITAGLMASGKQIVEAVFSTYIVMETIGKTLSIIIAYIIIKAIPDRSLLKFKYGANFIKEK